jgi:hypothetical protein
MAGAGWASWAAWAVRCVAAVGSGLGVVECERASSAPPKGWTDPSIRITRSHPRLRPQAAARRLVPPTTTPLHTSPLHSPTAAAAPGTRRRAASTPAPGSPPASHAIIPSSRSIYSAVARCGLSPPELAPPAALTPARYRDLSSQTPRSPSPQSSPRLSPRRPTASATGSLPPRYPAGSLAASRACACACTATPRRQPAG